MKNRILISILIVAVLAGVFLLKAYVSPLFFDFFIAIIAGLGAYEMSNMLARVGKFNFKYLAVCFAPFLMALNILGVYTSSKVGTSWVLAIFVACDFALAVLFALLGFLWSLIVNKKTREEMKIRKTQDSLSKFSFKKACNTIYAMLYPSIALMFFVFINHISELPGEKVSALGGGFSLFMLLSAVLIPCITDTFAMLCGMLIGGKKLCPKISPKKTISGAIGGTLFCVLILACVYLIFNSTAFSSSLGVSIWVYLLIVLIGSLISQAGDIFESFLKRKSDIKDSSHMLSSHGGFLDRTDSYMFVAPYMFLVAILLII